MLHCQFLRKCIHLPRAWEVLIVERLSSKASHWLLLLVSKREKLMEVGEDDARKHCFKSLYLLKLR
jgi:hypothetical protein